MKTTTWNGCDPTLEKGRTALARCHCGDVAKAGPAGCRKGWLSLLGVLGLGTAVAQAEIVVQDFFLPMPENQVYVAFNEQEPFDPTNVNMVAVFSIVVTTPDTMIVYDQWENGYESDLNNPTNVYSIANPGGTQIWGDGDNSNGICPGFTDDPFGLQAGTVIALQNEVPVPRDFGTHPFLYDAGDRIGATKAVTVSRACWESYQRQTAQASAVEVLSTLDHGNYYVAPVGTDVHANGVFAFVDLMVMADEDNTTVVVDPDGTGTSVTTNLIARGAPGAFMVNGILKGALVRADKPVQVHMVTGDAFDGQFETRSFVLRPAELWSSRYIIPLGTVNTNYPAFAYIFNTNATPMTVTYTINTNAGPSGSITVPGTNGLYALRLPLNSGTLLQSIGGRPFFAICTMGAGAGVTGSDYDWGFAPMPYEGLTPEAVCGWGPGADTNSEFWTGSENGSPVWIAALSNTTLYIDYHGDHLGPVIDPKGDLCDTQCVVSALEVKAIFDAAAHDQTGMRVYTVDGTLITGAWGESQDRAVASPGQPFMDMGYALVPFPTVLFTKTSTWAPGGDDVPTNVVTVGDVMRYTLKVNNKGLLPLGNLLVTDTPALQLRYITNSTTLNGIPIDDDNPSITSPFPLDNAGYTITVLRLGEAVFTYDFQIVSPGDILNSATAGDTPSTNQFPAYSPLTIHPAQVVEGNLGTTDLVFHVTMRGISEKDVTVAFSTSDGTAQTNGLPSDYIPTNGVLVIPAHETNGYITVKVKGDIVVEPNETLFVTLSNPTGDGVILDGVAQGTIIDDDVDIPPSLVSSLKWVYSPRRDTWYGTLTVSNSSVTWSLQSPAVWYEFKSNLYHRLRYPTGADSNGWYYLDLSAAFNSAVPLVGNGDSLLDPGETVVLSTNIELWGRSDVTNRTIMEDRVVATNWVYWYGFVLPPPPPPPAPVAEMPTPTLSCSALSMSPAVGTILEWSGSSQWYYTVEITPSLLPVVTWSNLPNCVNIPGFNGTMSAMDTNQYSGARFYRVRMTQTPQ